MASDAIDTLRSGVRSVVSWFQNNTRSFANVLTLFGPMVFLVIGVMSIRFGWESDLAVVILFSAALLWAAFTFFLRGYADRKNKGDSVPLPRERFTQVHEDGQVDVEYSRLQEMMLYVADVEDWAERKGRARWDH